MWMYLVLVVEKHIRLIEPNHISSVNMLSYHSADNILLKCLSNLSYVCFVELTESNVVRKTFMMVTDLDL